MDLNLELNLKPEMNLEHLILTNSEICILGIIHDLNPRHD